MLYLNLRICCGLGLITAWRPGTWVSSNWAPAKKSPGDVQKPRQRAWIPGTESEKKSQMRKLGQYDVTGPTFPLQAREEGDAWGPVSRQERGWVTRVSRLGEQETPGAGRAPTCGYWWLQGDQRLGELQLGPSCVGSIFPPQSGWEGDGAQVLLLPGSTVPELPNILLITSLCRTDGRWAS